MSIFTKSKDEKFIKQWMDFLPEEYQEKYTHFVALTNRISRIIDLSKSELLMIHKARVALYVNDYYIDILDNGVSDTEKEKIMIIKRQMNEIVSNYYRKHNEIAKAVDTELEALSNKMKISI